MNIKKDIREKLSKYLDKKLEKGDPYIFNEAVNFIKKDRAEQLILNLVSRSNAIDYKKGFELAMQYIDASPCDPDIYIDQLEMWESLQDFIKSNKIK